MMVVVRIQHHPDRARLLDVLLPSLGNLQVEVVEDPDPYGPRCTWPTYAKCLADSHADYVVVLQDDVVVCRGFEEELYEALEDAPDDGVVSLYTGAFPELTAIRVRQAFQREERWCRHQGWTWIPAVALAWPSGMVEEAERWCTEGRGYWPHEYPDDARLGHWAREHRSEVWHRIPNLVDHPGIAPSLLRTHAGSHHHSVVPGDRRVRFA